ncbi:hypothetical protein DNTS_033863 [Danionella cerebrum]|uniref:Uncharacterized protein n=1 Tax=Danionella cerebrum TaxID=2873325 RepID=A0A553Q644_9TELE|nr:hypothetical protein DNTS_033863 [Danionella translucida]
MQTRALIVALTLTLAINQMTTAEPLHAQCRIIWLFGIPCEEVFVSLVKQIKDWQGMSGCMTVGQRCLHTSRQWTSKEDLNFHLVATEESVCRVMIEDNGATYCTLFNLIDGSGLVEAEGFKQYTNEWICLDSSTANCTIY